MNNFNFFELCSDLNVNDNTVNLKSVLLCIIATVIICMSIYVYINFKLIAYKEQLKYTNKICENITLELKNNQVEDISTKVKVIEKEYEFIESIDNMFKIIDTVNTELLLLIDDSSIKNKVVVEEIYIKGVNIILKGVSKDIEMIANLEGTFRKSNKFSSVFISIIEKVSKEDNISKKFICELILNGGAI